jgi:hypothetical protein
MTAARPYTLSLLLLLFVLSPLSGMGHSSTQVLSSSTSETSLPCSLHHHSQQGPIKGKKAQKQKKPEVSKKTSMRKARQAKTSG